jgi:hypothetical protein
LVLLLIFLFIVFIIGFQFMAAPSWKTV